MPTTNRKEKQPLGLLARYVGLAENTMQTTYRHVFLPPFIQEVIQCKYQPPAFTGEQNLRNVDQDQNGVPDIYSQGLFYDDICV